MSYSRQPIILYEGFASEFIHSAGVTYYYFTVPLSGYTLQTNDIIEIKAKWTKTGTAVGTASQPQCYFSTNGTTASSLIFNTGSIPTANQYTYIRRRIIIKSSTTFEQISNFSGYDDSLSNYTNAFIAVRTIQPFIIIYGSTAAQSGPQGITNFTIKLYR